MSTHDTLTGLFNRAYFDAEMTRMAQSRQYPISLVLADIDGLKPVNDNFGHTKETSSSDRRPRLFNWPSVVKMS